MVEMKKLLFILCTLVSANVLLAQRSVTVNGLNYKILDDGSAEVTGLGNSALSVIDIPSSVTYNGTTYSVTSIGNEAFKACNNITSVTMPNTVTSVGTGIFERCANLTNVFLSNNLTELNEEMFSMCTSLTSIDIPGSVTVIRWKAFYQCTSLSSVTLNEGLDSIFNNVFEGCTALTSILVPSTVRHISELAFDKCTALTRINVASGNARYSSVDGIVYNLAQDSLLFLPSGRSSLTISSNVTSIYMDNFCENVTLDNITVVADNPRYSAVDGILYSKLQDTLVRCPAPKTSISIPSTVTAIGDMAFVYSSLTSINIPTGVTSIGYCAFTAASALTSVVIPTGVTQIGEYAFSVDTALTSINLPEGLTEIKAGVFNECTSLSSVSIPTSVTSIGDFAFSGCSNLTSVTIPNGVGSIGYRTFDYSGITSIDIPSSVSSIGYAAFYGCRNLSSITLHEGLVTIDTRAFFDCQALTSVDIPNSVTSVGIFCFAHSGVTSVTIGSGLTKLSSDMFQECTSLNSITIPNTVDTIGDGAFIDCSGLISVTIGTGVTLIRPSAFMDCTNLTSVTSLAEMPPDLGSRAFSGINAACTLTVPCGSLEAYSSTNWQQPFSGRISEPLEFDVNVSVNQEAYGNVATHVESCSVITLTAMANAGYGFAAWNDGNTENPRTITLTQDTSLVAIFEAIGPGITVSANDNTMGNASFTRDGDVVTLTATPNEGYEFVKWNDENTENPRTVTLTQDTAFVAIFAEIIYDITVTTNDNTMGNASFTREGNTVTLTATPNEGYEFVKWNDENTENPRTITLTQNTAMEAIFAQAGSSALQDISVGTFALYPNPAKNFVVLEFETLNVNTPLQILDMNGRRVKSLEAKAGESTLKIDLTDLAKGIYTLTLGTETKKLVIE